MFYFDFLKKQTFHGSNLTHAQWNYLNKYCSRSEINLAIGWIHQIATVHNYRDEKYNNINFYTLMIIHPPWSNVLPLLYSPSSYISDFHFNRPLPATSLVTQYCGQAKWQLPLLDMSSKIQSSMKFYSTKTIVCDKSTKIVHLKNFTMHGIVYLFVYTYEKNL